MAASTASLGNSFTRTSGATASASRPVAAALTVIATSAKLIGKLSSEGSAEIHGHVDGDIEVGEDLVISESGVANSAIVAKTTKVYGRVDGSISCSALIELKAGACVTGRVIAPRIVMEDGVVFEGTCSMSPLADKKAPASAPLVANS